LEVEIERDLQIFGPKYCELFDFISMVRVCVCACFTKFNDLNEWNSNIFDRRVTENDETRVHYFATRTICAYKYFK